jgi:eukaryotic-like serine/threonine-protein kinase
VPELDGRLEVALRGRYRIDRELGRGGMAVVYLAHDLRHDRPVAIKVMQPEISQCLGTERFVREIRLTARLRHPHLLPVYDSGDAGGSLYYVVPYIEGGSLRQRLESDGRLPLKLALSLMREAADALDYAHRHDVVHRDIKPENILLEDGHAIVADFGVARALSAATEVRAQASLTQTGLMIGTPAYMSPEQADLAPVDGRSDIYSLGCVLYEVITGRPVFTGSSPLELLAKRFAAKPPSLRDSGVSIPAVVGAIITRTLAVHPEDRYGAARDLADAIALAEADVARGEVVSPEIMQPARVPALAVLPFVNMSRDPENEYFSDGLTEELIGAFTKIPGLRVASRTSAFAFKGKGLDVREIGERLNVTVVLDGSVRRSGERLRLSAQLIGTGDGYHIWSETYDRHLADIFEIQDELSRAIVGALKVKLVGSQTAVLRPPTTNLVAYNAYLRGRFFWNKRTPDAFRKGIECFEQAIAADPGYALPHAGIADSYHTLAIYGVVPPMEAYPKARAAAIRTLELDGQRAEAHTSSAYVSLCFDWDFPEAEQAFKRAIELDPAYAPAHHWNAWHWIIRGRKDKAVAEARRAMELEPLSPLMQVRPGQILRYAGELDEAFAAAQRAAELDPTFWPAYEQMGAILMQRQQFGEAVDILRRGAPYPGSLTPYLLPWLHALAGQTSEAQTLLDRLRRDPATARFPGYSGGFVAAALGTMGDLDDGFRWIDRLYDERQFIILLARIEPCFAAFRDDPRYDSLVRRVGLM